MSRQRHLVLGSLRELGTVGLVAALCGGYAAVLIMCSSILATAAQSRGGSGAALLLAAVSVVFVLIALYVAAIVISNAVDTVIAGRLRQIALLRLLGARARSLRRSVMRGTLSVGLLGSAVGVVVGVGAAHVFRLVMVARGTLPDLAYPWVSVWLVPTVLLVAATAGVAGWLGSRSVLRVTPAQAMSGSAVALASAPRTSRRRAAISILLVAAGALMLAAGAYLGEDASAGGFLFAFLGAATSGAGLLVGARLVIPGAVAVLSRPLGDDPSARVARRNAVKDPLRTTRSTMGLVIGVTLVTTIASGMQALTQSVRSWQDMTAAQQAEAEQILTVATAILIAIVVISSIIAAVGFVSTMSLTVIQRRREIGLLRALGFTRAQVRRMITQESAAMSGAAVALGLGLGLLYGSLGAESLVGALTDGFVWGVPWPLLLAVAAAGVVLVLVAARPPARRALQTTPIEALRME